MRLIRFPLERVVDINEQILKTEAGFKGVPDLGKLQGALSRIDNAIWYEGLDDVFEIAAKYASSRPSRTRCLMPINARPSRSQSSCSH